jgi:hypothetical protein
MIVKSLSRKGKHGSRAVLKYIFKYVFRDGIPLEGDKLLSPDINVRIPKRVRHSQKDVEYLKREIAEGKLYAEFRRHFTGDYAQFIKEHLIKDTSPLIIKHNVRGNSIEDWIRQFQDNEAQRLYNRSDAVNVHHTIISFGSADKDKITSALLSDIAQEYIRLRGDNSMLVGTVHANRDHLHLHLAVSGTLINGMASRVSKAEFQQIKVKLQEYQRERYPELENSIVNHTGERQLEKRAVQNYKNARTPLKASLLDCLNAIQPLSTEHLLHELSAKGFEPYYRNEKLTGVRHSSGLKFRLGRLGVDLEGLARMDEEMESLAVLRKRTKDRTLDQDVEKATTLLDKELAELADIRDSRKSELSLDRTQEDSKDVHDEPESDSQDENDETINETDDDKDIGNDMEEAEQELDDDIDTDDGDDDIVD